MSVEVSAACSVCGHPGYLHLRGEWYEGRRCVHRSSIYLPIAEALCNCDKYEPVTVRIVGEIGPTTSDNPR